MNKKHIALIIALGIAATISAPAQSALTTPFTLTANSGPVYLMLTWDPINGWATRTSGQTTVVYFTAPVPDDGEGDPAEPAQIDSYGYGGYTGNLNGITPGEETFGVVLNASSQFSDPSVNDSSFNPANGENQSYFGIDYNAGGGNYNYGWVEYSTTSDTITLDEAYMDNTLNDPITVGEGVTPAPEPSTLVLGAVGLGTLMIIARGRGRKFAVRPV